MQVQSEFLILIWVEVLYIFKIQRGIRRFSSYLVFSCISFDSPPRLHSDSKLIKDHPFDCRITVQ
jgi:hypothetical protein